MEQSRKTIELLAPAGSFEGLIGAINGGADAVYLAGDRFGARAFASNFTEEELERALFLSKLHGIKVYLTVNTLLKNSEMDELYDYIKPLYEKGLDGVIIQDFGVFRFLKAHFPGLELHASTQMTVTSKEGALYLKQNGMKRVVLARELTLKEVKDIVAEGIETECFIHGSMCYCYSGQCLFSSLIGGRSGNRGRCAQPCRLPYRMNGSKQSDYCLSLKDMCTLDAIPALIDSGIASFKIEGRMKNPAYAAYVTAVYRKYIDLYLADPKRPYKVDPKDLEHLRHLYIRTALHDGYYYQQRGSNMVTKENPAYSKVDEGFVQQITQEMIETKPVKNVCMEADFTKGKPCSLRINTEINEKTYEVSVEGAEAQEAMKAPLSIKDIQERLAKIGDTPFKADSVRVQTSGNVFLPVKAINELRRQGMEALHNAIASDFTRTEAKEPVTGRDEVFHNKEKTNIYIGFAETIQQYEAIYSRDYIKRIVLPYHWLLRDDISEIKKDCIKAEKEVYFRMPAVCRNDSFEKIRKALDIGRSKSIMDGIYVNQVDSLSYILEHFPDVNCVGDIHMYVMNNEAEQWFADSLNGFTIPIELNKDELKKLKQDKGEMILYGRTPLMQTANCIFLTNGECHKNNENKIGHLTDRTNTTFPFRAHCEEAVCYNTIYNSVATSLHKHKRIIDSLDCNRYQLRFTVENRRETEEVLDFYESYAAGTVKEQASFAYTNGHFLRGVW